MTLKLHNTLTHKTETFTPIGDKVTLYTCGPTVYDYLHVGNWAAYVYWDTLVRVLLADGYQVERVMNITDVGHLVSDEDTGEDKLEKGARREGKTAWEVAEFYGEDFLKGMEKLGLIMPEHTPKATDFISQQLDLIRILKEKSYTYQINDGIYFDTSKFPTYAAFASLDLEAQKAGARVEFNPEKRNPSDFALWKFTAKGETRDMEWETPKDLLEYRSGVSLSSNPESPPSIPSKPTSPRRDDLGEASLSSAELATAQTSSTSQEASSRSSGSLGNVSSETEGGDSAGDATLAQGVSSRSTILSSKYLQPESNASPGPDISPGAKPFTGEYGGKGEQKSTEGKKRMGFPGWHLECSAMAMSILGPTIDIHTGGIDHIPVHHTNEIAQSEAASGQQFAHYWLHNNHLKVDGTKISKSLGNGYTLQDLEERGFSPLDYRMFVLQSQYSNEGNFTFDNLTSAKNRLHHWRNIAALRHQTHDTLDDDDDKAMGNKNITLLGASGAMKEALNNDLNTPEALRVIDQAFSRLDGKALKSIHQHGLNQLLTTIDELLGFNLQLNTPDIDDETKQLILERDRARDARNWARSDELRAELKEKGIVLRDTTSGSIWEYLA